MTSRAETCFCKWRILGSHLAAVGATPSSSSSVLQTFHLLLMGNLPLSSVLLRVGTNPFLPASVKAGCPFTSGSEQWDIVELSVFLFLLLDLETCGFRATWTFIVSYFYCLSPPP